MDKQEKKGYNWDNGCLCVKKSYRRKTNETEHKTDRFALSYVTMSFVRHGDNKIEARKGIEAFDVED